MLTKIQVVEIYQTDILKGKIYGSYPVNIYGEKNHGVFPGKYSLVKFRRGNAPSSRPLPTWIFILGIKIVESQVVVRGRLLRVNGPRAVALSRCPIKHCGKKEFSWPVGLKMLGSTRPSVDEVTQVQVIGIKIKLKSESWGKEKSYYI